MTIAPYVLIGSFLAPSSESSSLPVTLEPNTPTMRARTDLSRFMKAFERADRSSLNSCIPMCNRFPPLW
eukprot:Gb_41093 [translate_table: standard]